MPTVIDELIVVLGLDATKFTAEQRKVVESWRKTREASVAGGKEVEKGLAGVADMAKTVTTRFLALGALFAGGLGIKKFTDDIRNLATEMTNLDRQARNANLTAQQFYKFGQAGKAIGLNPAEIQSSILAMQREVANFQVFAGGNPMIVQALKQMGVSASDLGTPEGTEKALGKINQRANELRKSGRNQAQINAYLGSVGISEGSAAFFSLPEEKFQRLLKMFKDYAPDEKQLKAFENLQEHATAAEAAVDKLGIAMKAGLTPALTAFYDWVKSVADYFLGFTGSKEHPMQPGTVYPGTGTEGVTPGVTPEGAGPQGSGGGPRGSLSGNLKATGQSIWDRTIGSTVSSASAAPSPATATGSESGGPISGSSGLSNVAAGGQINIPQGASSGGGSTTSGAVPSDILARAKSVALQGGPGAVSQFMASQGYPKSGNWCGEFAAAVVKSSGGTPPKNPEVASNWRNFGTQVDTPMPGDVAVRKGARTGSTGSHVTFVENVDGGRFTGIGGNQGHTAKESNFSVGRYDFFRSSAKSDRWGQDAQPVPFGDWLTNAQTRNMMKTSGISTTNNRTNNETTVGNITVNTQATDAFGIARDLKPYLSNNDQTQGFNYGPN